MWKIVLSYNLFVSEFGDTRDNEDEDEDLIDSRGIFLKILIINYIS